MLQDTRAREEPRAVTEFPEPSAETADAAVLFSRYLRFYRETVVRKLRSFSE